MFGEVLPKIVICQTRFQMGPLGGDLEIRVLTRCPSLPRSRPLDPRADQDSDQARISRKMAAEVQLQEEGMAEMRRRRCDTETASHCLQRTFLASCSGLNGMLNGSAAMILPHKLCVLKASHVMSLSPGTMPACRFWRHCPLPSFALSLFHCLTVSLSLALLSLLLSMFHHSSPPPPIPRFSPSFFVISVSVLANSLLGDSRAWSTHVPFHHCAVQGWWIRSGGTCNQQQTPRGI